MQNKQTARDQLDDESPSRVEMLDTLGQQQSKQPQDMTTNSATALNQSAQPHQDNKYERYFQDQIVTQNNTTHHPNSLLNIDFTQNHNQDLSIEATQRLAHGCQAIQTNQQSNQANCERADRQNDEKTQNERRDQRASGNAIEQSVTELDALKKQETIQLTSQIDQSIQNLGQEAQQVDNQPVDTISEEQPSRSSQNVSDKNSKMSHYMSMTQTQNGNRLNCPSSEQQTQNMQHQNPLEQTYVASQQPEQLVNKQLELLTQLLQGQKGLGQLTQQLQPADGISQNQTQTVTQIQNQAKLLSQVDQNAVKDIQSQVIPILNSGNAYQTGINVLPLQEQSVNLLNKQSQFEQRRLSNHEVKSSALQGTNDVDSGLKNPDSLTKTECLKQIDNTMQSEQLYNLKSHSLQDNSQKFEQVYKERRASIQGMDDMQKLFQLWQTDQSAKAQGKTIESEAMGTLLTRLMSKQEAQQTDNSGGSLADSKQTGFKEISGVINSNATNQSNISTRVMNQRTVSNISSQYPISEQEHQCLLAQLRNQSNEIHQLKAFIIMHMLFGQSNHGDSHSNFISSVMQNFMIQMLMQNTNKKFGEMAPNYQSLFDSTRPPINNDSSNQSDSQNTVNQMMQITKLMQQIEQIERITGQRQGINRSNALPQQSSAVESILGKRTIHQMQESNPINQDCEPLLDQCAQKYRKLQQAQHQDCNYIRMPQNQKEQSIAATCKFQNTSTLNQKEPANKHEFSAKEIQGAQAGKLKSKSEVAASNQQEQPAESEKSSQDDRIELQNTDPLPDQTGVDRASDLCSAIQNGFSQSVDHQYEGTSAFLRLKAQIKKNMLYEQFMQMKNEIMGVVVVSDPNQILINDKPKRLHHNMGDNSFRGSKFRGVSKNKCKWQMMIMINQKKVYIGAIHTELEAAKYYDHIAILTQGLHAKTNFAYSASQLESIVNDYDFTVEQDGQALRHFQSKFSSNQNHTLNTSNIKKEQISIESLQKDNLNQTGQLKEYGTQLQSSSDGNLKTGKHDFKTKQQSFDKTVSESINESISYGANRKINEETELDGQLHQKIEQLGFSSLQHLLNFVQANNITNQATQDNKATLRDQEFNSVAMQSNGFLNSETNKNQKQQQDLNQSLKSQGRPCQKQSDILQPQTGLNLQKLLFKNQNMMNNGALLSKQIQSINQQVLKSCPDQQNNNDANQQTEKVKAQGINEELMKPRVSPHLKVHLEQSLQQTNSLNKQQINNQLLGQRLHIQQQAIQNSSHLLGGLGGSNSNQTSFLNLDQLKMLQQQASQKTNNYQAAVPFNGLQNQFSRANVGMDQIAGAQMNQTNEQHSRLENCLSTNQQSLPAKAKQSQVVGLGSKQQLIEQQAVQMLKNLKQKQDAVSSTIADLPRASEVLRATFRKQSGIALSSVKLPQDQFKTHPSNNDQFTKK